MMAVLSSLQYIHRHPPPISKINLYTDCQSILQYLNFSAFPKYNTVKIIIEAILKTLTLMQYKSPALKIYLKKVKSHTDISGNNTIDALVKEATDNMVYDKHQYKYIPYTVTLTQIHKFVTKKWKNNWRKESNKNKLITKCHNKFNLNIHHLINYSKLNKHQCGIIIRLLSEHIELNKYLFKLQIKCPTKEEIPNSPECNFCNKKETVGHFLTKCNKFKKQRSKLINKLSKINHKYRYKKFQTPKFLLFPYLLQHNNIKKQAMVWKEILNYTKETQRFNNLYRIDLKQL